MGQKDSDRLSAEALAALDDLGRRARGAPPARDTVGLSGTIEDFPERFLAWTWLARRLSDRYDLPEPLTVSLKRSMIGITEDEEMAQHEDEVAAVLNAQDRGDADEVDARLASFDSAVSQGPAMQMIVLTTEEVLRQAARKCRRFQAGVVEQIRTEMKASMA